MSLLYRFVLPLSIPASIFAAPAPSQPWPLKSHDTHRQAAAACVYVLLYPSLR